MSNETYKAWKKIMESKEQPENNAISIAQRLREYSNSPHHINPMSEGFMSLIEEAISELSGRAVLAQEAGKQEPIAYMRNEGTPNNLVKCTFTCPGAFGVYRDPPAPVSADLSAVRAYHAEAQAKLPAYANDHGLRESDVKHYRKRAAFHAELIASIDKVKELNQ